MPGEKEIKELQKQVKELQKQITTTKNEIFGVVPPHINKRIMEAEDDARLHCDKELDKRDKELKKLDKTITDLKKVLQAITRWRNEAEKRLVLHEQRLRISDI